MHHVLRSRRLPTDPSILMNWVNALIESDFCSLEDLRSGIVWCHLLEAIYPGSIDLESLEADKMGWQWNYRVLKRALNNLGLYPHINVHELVSGRVGDTIYLLHFFIDVFTVILGRKIKDREHHSSKEPRNFKSSSTIEVIVQWFKSFFVKEKEKGPEEEESDEKRQLEFHRQALLLLFLPIPDGCSPVSTEEMVRRLGDRNFWPEQDDRNHPSAERLAAYRRQKNEDHRILRSLVESCMHLRRGRQLMEQLWLASLKEHPAK
ncbi:uncharacterized protein LOC108049682 isoform X1 [Drosophila rhopaloa]|uniref:Uncharacterized protein LOC108049682 isoform X1 n=1 Tax=Drosophila rhopaloa TaxID=1041015 RepID=A0A6P4FBF5_DRORH|nr:uncharacterized protein LOC108049682 isoform X1 [Drosophila rhopaloa]